MDGQCLNTEALKHAPCAARMLDSFDCRKLRARLLSLEPGSRIHWHYDRAYKPDMGFLRVHIPIVVSHEAADWKPGEIWTADFSFPHCAVNASRQRRIHLVCDMVMNAEVAALLPAHYVQQIDTRRAYRPSLKGYWISIRDGRRAAGQALPSESWLRRARHGSLSWAMSRIHSGRSTSFACESLFIKSHWVMVVMDQFTRRIIGFAVQPGSLDGPAICRMFNEIIAGRDILPFHLSSDNDPLFEFRQWQANLRILEVTELKTVPYVPLSHPFIERLIGTIRRELLDQALFWTATDLERKLLRFQAYYNQARIHASLDGITPDAKAANQGRTIAKLNDYRWKSHCRGLYQLPAAA